MAVGSGIGSQLGIAPEVTYGTYVAPTRFFEVRKPEVMKVKNTAQWDGLAAGRLVTRSDGRAVTTKAATLSLDELVVVQRDMGLLFNQIMGGTALVVQQGATAAWLQTHALVDTAGKMFTAQAGVPLIGGSVIPQSALGCKVTSAEFSCGVDELLTMKVDADARDITEAQALAAASYAAPRRPFHFGQMAVTSGASVGGAVASDGVRKISLKIDRNLNTGQFYANGLGLKDQPVTNDFVAVSGTITADYKTAANWADRFRDDTGFALVWTFTGPLIASTFFEQISFILPAVFLDGDTPSVDGPDVVGTDFPFVVRNDLSNNPFTITYMSIDTVI